MNNLFPCTSMRLDFGKSCRFLAPVKEVCCMFHMHGETHQNYASRLCECGKTGAFVNTRKQREWQSPRIFGKREGRISFLAYVKDALHRSRVDEKVIGCLPP